MRQVILKKADILFQENIFFISGKINFSNLMFLYNKSLQSLTQLLENLENNSLTFDFSKVEVSNSAGLTLLIEWWKLARKNKKQIQFTHVPEDLILIAKAANIDHLLGLNIR